MSERDFDDLDIYPECQRVAAKFSDPMAILDIKGACEYLNVSRSFLYKHIESGSIPYARISKRIFFVKRDLFNWICSNLVRGDKGAEVCGDEN